MAYVVNVPQRVEFCVCSFLYFVLFSVLFPLLQVDMRYQGDSVEFISLEKLDVPRATHIDGEESMSWE